MNKRKLITLCEAWEFQAKKQFQAAEYEETELGRRALEYGGMIYYNVSNELRAAIHPQLQFGLFFNIFHQYFKRPRSGRF